MVRFCIYIAALWFNLVERGVTKDIIVGGDFNATFVCKDLVLNVTA